ncbi:uncharacterized protein IL334_000096 [Kwoniella shivajii]|uniref:Zn(2)-C6 fungal-type domain-containing protein n=1 Tax=Kwoniella shivajii TaxID=564305 RepID=A0ABZ1CNS2_9TREE|nr:hypothetical protein IL334_000096 [Kwoniella shivajii]
MDFPESGPSGSQPSPSRSERQSSTATGAEYNTSDKGKRKADGLHRPKNLQACDRCRRKKTKCEPLETRRDLCQNCNYASLNCTFDLPLTASRTKRVRNGIYQSHGAVWPVEDERRSPRRTEVEEDERIYFDRSGSEGVLTTPVTIPRARSVLGLTPLRTTSTRREGCTSLSYILHSTPTLPISYLSEYDDLHHLSMQVTPADSGNGYILVTAPSRPMLPSEPPAHVIEALNTPSWTEVVNRLVETYLVHISPLIPVVTRQDMPEVTQTLCHAMAAVAAARRNCPKEIFDCLNYIVTQEMYEQDTMSDPTRQNVQTLLVTCLVDELALQSSSATPTSVSRARLTAAIRLAQDLSMDQSDTNTSDSEADRRIWRCAIVIDQWNAARTGARPIIASSAIPRDTSRVIENGNADFFGNLYSLSGILANILSKVYGPDGINKTRNEEIYDIKNDLLKWQEKIPYPLRFDGSRSSIPAGILHLLYTSITFLLYRPFMRWSFICPSHIDLSLDIPVWMDLNPAARHALEWATNQDDPADLLFFGPYALGLMSLVQYHSYARRREWDGVMILEKFEKTTNTWIEAWGEGRMPLQTAHLQIVSLLHSCAQKAAQDGTTSFDSVTSRRGLNPTPGVLNRLPEAFVHGVTFLRDPAHPQGGVLVATQRAAQEIKDLPPGTVIIGGPPVETGVVPGVTTVAGTASVGNLPSLSYTTLPSSAGFDGQIANETNDGRISMSTPDWQAIVSSFSYPLDTAPHVLNGN